MIRMGQNQKSNTIRKYSQGDFMTCNSCFWCASNLSGYSPTVCPACGSNKMELIPISKRESFRLNIDGAGVSIEFWNLPKI